MNSRAPTVYIHIGRGKTGTSAFQRMMAMHCTRLLEFGVLYPAAAGGSRGIGHDIFGKAFIDTIPPFMKPPKNVDAELDALRAEILGATVPRILIHSEQLELANPARVKEFFEASGVEFDIKIIFFVRSQDELVESEYNQLIKMRGMTKALVDFAADEFSGDFLETALAWEAVHGSGNIICRVYDARRHRVAAQVFEAMGMPDLAREFPAPPSVNTSVSYKALTLARLLNGIELENRVAIYEQVSRGIPHDEIPALLFDTESAAAFRASFAQSNREFSKRFLGSETSDLGGRRYTDHERDTIRRKIDALRIDRF